MKILDVCRVAPSSNSPTEFSLPLTFYDIFWFKQPPVERLFFYKLNDLTPACFNSVIVPKLKHSLSLTLLHYLPLAGNLRWPSDAPKPIILYTPTDGVSLTVAESDADFNLLSSGGVYEAVDLHPLIPQLITSDDSAPTIALQITLFPNMGFCIGIAAHHAVLDGKASTLFIKSWAHMCKLGDTLPPELTPFFDRNVIDDTSDLDMLFLNQWLTGSKVMGSDSETKKKNLLMVVKKEAVPDLVRATFEINREELKLLRERVLSDLSDSDEQLHLSSFVLTLAYVSICMVNARGGDGDRTVFIGFTVDCRPRLNPPVPENYFGNCNTVKGHVGKARDCMDEQGLAFAVEKLSGFVKEMAEKGVLAGIEKKCPGSFNDNEEFIKSIQFISVAGSNRFDVYGSDFGWGKPLKVVVVSIDKNEAISMAESRDGKGGVEIGLALKKHEMNNFTSLFLKGIRAEHVH